MSTGALCRHLQEFAAAQQQHKVQIQEEQRLRNKTKVLAP